MNTRGSDSNVRRHPTPGRRASGKRSWKCSQTGGVGLEAGAAVVATTARTPRPAWAQGLQLQAVVVWGEGRLETGRARAGVAEGKKAGSSRLTG